MNNLGFCSKFFALAIVLFLVCGQVDAQGLPRPEFKLKEPGELIIPYEKFGKFEHVGTAEYRYVITDKAALAQAAGTGVYPNNQNIYNEEAYQKFFLEKRLSDHPSKYTDRQHELNFYRWLVAQENPGVKYFNVALNLEKAGLIAQAVKAYHAIIVHFPNSVAMTSQKTPWHPAVAASDRIRFLLRRYPKLGIEWKDGSIYVVNAYDNNIKNDIYICNPGKLIHRRAKSEKVQKLKEGDRQLGKGKVSLVQFKNGHWQLLVEGKPFTVKGLSYSPTPVGESPEYGTLSDWMQKDSNKNSIIDGPYESWIDKNWNDEKDPNEPTVGDFALMHEMHANTIRIYHAPDHPEQKTILRDLHNRFGIYTMMGNLVGMYARESGALWTEGTDYRDPVQREKMFESVKQMVKEYKNEPYVLMWVLGNENIYGIACNANLYPKEYFTFINEIAQWIHKEDPNHPVAIANGDLLYLEYIAKLCPDIDIIGANVYRGKQGPGYSFWESVHRLVDKPVLITEFGCSAFFKNESRQYAEKEQAEYLQGNWEDIQINFAGRGFGNAIGGVLFEWMDEWWKTMGFRDPHVHKIDAPWAGPFPDGFLYEEWLGIFAQGSGQHSPFIRQPRQAFYYFRDQLWKD